MISDVIERIRKVEGEKEREIREAEKEAARILSQVETEISHLREVMFREAEEKAAEISQAILARGRAEGEAIREEYTRRAQRLREVLANRITTVARELVRRVQSTYADK
ncbi:MAG: hypothetical protein ABDK93_04605 [Atribacterota bacterium]